MDDLLALQFELRNLRIEHRRRKPARLVRIRGGEDALLIIGFPGQHILEQAYPEGAADNQIVLPAKSRIARPSRLVFKIPPDRDHIDLTFDALLDWRDWIPVLPERSRGGRIVAPSADRSIVELPYGLALSPEGAARWAHATRPVTHAGRTELWHTRLTSGDPHQPPAVTILQPDDPTDDFADVDTSLTAEDREQLAGRTAEARTLILSPIGGWLDVRGKWETDSPIARWQHIATAGQDQRVVIQRAEGFLYPFGQRAALITVTERKLGSAPAGRAPHALLRKRHFVVIKKPEMEYEHGKMALRQMTVLDLVTPPLHNPTPAAGPFWIETALDEPFLFRFRAQDWAERRLWLEAPAIFVTERGGIAQAEQFYKSSDASRRTSPLRGQSAAVAKFDSAIESDMDSWGTPLSKPRSIGDTTLNMLNVEFDGKVKDNPAEGSAPFTCLTARMEVRVPSLEQYLDDEKNKGWFELVDPDAPKNLGEIFAKAQAENGARIPMYFDEQADRCGGVAAPSFDVDGLSRVRGPVGDARVTGPMYAGGSLEPETYFNAEHAKLLGGFPLAGLLLTDDGTRSPAVPTIKFSMSRKQPDEEAAKKGAQPHWEVGLGLSWSIALQKLQVGFASFVPKLDKDGKSKARLLIETDATKTLGKTENPNTETQKTQTANGGDESGATGVERSEAQPKTPVVNWSVSGKITQFAFELATGLGRISIGFDHFGVKLGPPKPKKRDEQKDPKDDKEEKDDKQHKEKKVAAEIDYKLSEIEADGVLFFLIKLLQVAADLPRIPDLSTGEASSVYPAKLPGVGDADINVTVGPIETPRFKWLKFNVTNVSASVGVGLYFLPRRLKKTEPPSVPDNLFTIRIASADKPLTLTAEPWGGLAHAGFNFTAKGVTGLQGSLGIVYRAEFDLGAAKAKCEGSLAGVFTYAVSDNGNPLRQFDLVLKLSGQATIAGFIDIHLALLAVGSWRDRSWFFFAEISVRVKIAFFAVSARFRFNYELAGGGGGGDRKMLAATAAPDGGQLSESEWLAYRSAFAQEA